MNKRNVTLLTKFDIKMMFYQKNISINLIGQVACPIPVPAFGPCGEMVTTFSVSQSVHWHGNTHSILSIYSFFGNFPKVITYRLLPTPEYQSH